MCSAGTHFKRRLPRVERCLRASHASQAALPQGTHSQRSWESGSARPGRRGAGPGSPPGPPWAHSHSPRGPPAARPGCGRAPPPAAAGSPAAAARPAGAQKGACERVRAGTLEGAPTRAGRQVVAIMLNSRASASPSGQDGRASAAVAQLPPPLPRPPHQDRLHERHGVRRRRLILLFPSGQVVVQADSYGGHILRQQSTAGRRAAGLYSSHQLLPADTGAMRAGRQVNGLAAGRGNATQAGTLQAASRAAPTVPL